MPDDGAPETVLFFVALVPDALEFVEVILDQAIQAGRLGISRPVDSLEDAVHMESDFPRRLWANSMCIREAGPADALHCGLRDDSLLAALPEVRPAETPDWCPAPLAFTPFLSYIGRQAHHGMRSASAHLRSMYPRWCLVYPALAQQGIAVGPGQS
jgi:hypothetical protein